MNPPLRRLCTAGIPLLMFGLLHSALGAQMPKPAAKKATLEQVAPGMTIWQAQKNLITALQGTDRSVPYWFKQPPSEIKIDAENIQFLADMDPAISELPPGRYDIDLRRIGAIRAVSGFAACAPRVHCVFVDEKRPIGSNLILKTLWWTSAEAAESFADAINYLSWVGRGGGSAMHEAAWASFRQSAATWRALTPKPPISENVRRHFLLAEDSFQRKQLDSAIQEYEAALEIDPVRPEGHYNAAFLYGELKYWEEAAWHMRCYLELVPDAPDAQQARDQLLVWQAKLEQAASLPAAEDKTPKRRK